MHLIFARGPQIHRFRRVNVALRRQSPALGVHINPLAHMYSGMEQGWGSAGGGGGAGDEGAAEMVQINFHVVTPCNLHAT